MRLQLLGQFFTNAPNSRLQVVLSKKVIHFVQIGFAEKHRTTKYLFTLKSFIWKYVFSNDREKILEYFVDFRKDYDSA